MQGDATEEFFLAVENLDATVAAVGDVNVVLGIDSDAVRGVELARLVAGFAQDLSQVPSLSI